MANPDDFLYEYAVVRYVPRVEREEFINIGLIMMCKRRKWLKGEIYIDEARVKALDAHTNLDFLRHQASLFTRDDVPAADLPVEERYRWLAAVKSAVLQVSPSHPGFAPAAEEEYEKSLSNEFSRLFTLLVR